MFLIFYIIDSKKKKEEVGKDFITRLHSYENYCRLHIFWSEMFDKRSMQQKNEKIRFIKQSFIFLKMFHLDRKWAILEKATQDMERMKFAPHKLRFSTFVHTVEFDENVSSFE